MHKHKIKKPKNIDDMHCRDLVPILVSDRVTTQSKYHFDMRSSQSFNLILKIELRILQLTQK